MWKIYLTCVLLVGFSSASQQKRYINNGGGYAPDYGFVDPYEFHQKLSQQIMDQQYQQNRIFQEQFAHQQRLFDNLRQQSLAASGAGSRVGGFGGGAGAGSGAFSGASSSGYGSGSGTGFGSGTSYGYGPNYGSQSGYNPGYGTRSGSAGGGGAGSYAPNYASASGSYGPGGGHQTASIFPENPNVPNINTRFDDSDTGGYSAGGDGGFRGVSVSSYSSSSNVNGKKTNQRGATTTINDNGKITTYHVNS